MKLLLYIFPILLIASCGQTSNQNIVDSAEIKTNITAQTTDTVKTRNNPIQLDSLKSIEIFKDFALSYSPTREPNSGVAMLPEPSDSVLGAIKISKTTQPTEFEKYLILIFVKLYSAHMECCHQSYEIRRQPPGGLDKSKDPLVYEFNDLTKKYSNKKRIEFISSHIGYDYVMTHKHLLDFEPIKKHIKIIEQVQKNIEEGVYWK